MGNCSTCTAEVPGFIPVDLDTRERLPQKVAPLDYEGSITFEPCPECNQGRRLVFLTAPVLLDRTVDRDGFPKDWNGDREHPSWKPHLRGGAPTPAGKLRPVKALVKGAAGSVAKQGALLPEKSRKSPGI